MVVMVVFVFTSLSIKKQTHSRKLEYLIWGVGRGFKIRGRAKGMLGVVVLLVELVEEIVVKSVVIVVMGWIGRKCRIIRMTVMACDCMF